MSITVFCFLGENMSLSEDDDGKVFVIVSDSLQPHELVILARLIAIANAPEIASANECAKKIALIGATMPCENHSAIHSIGIKRSLDFNDDLILMQDKDNYPSLAQVKKIPIPAQCKKAKNNTRKH